MATRRSTDPRLPEARRLRSEEGLSKSQIATRLDVAPSTLTSWLADLPAPAWTKRPNAKDALRAKARALRLDGWSVTDLAAELSVAKSTVSLWVRDLPLDRGSARARRRREHAAMMAEARWGEYRRYRDDCRAATQHEASLAVGPLTDREILHLGALIYWCEGGKAKPWREHCGVQFINSDPQLIALFLRFLRVAGVADDRLRFRVHIHEDADVSAAVTWWANVVGVAPATFQPAVLKRHNPRTVRKNTGDDYRGCLVVVVSRGRELYWRIEGLVAGVAGPTSIP